MSVSALEKLFDTEPPWCLGVLNLTPDSFSDGGKYLAPDAGLLRAQQLILDGAHAIDIGGEATGPTSSPISADDEISRIAYVVSELGPKAILSIDTYKSETADFALARGAQIINDTSALRADPVMAEVIREYNAFVVLMFAKDSNPMPHVRDHEIKFNDVVEDVAEFLLGRAEFAVRKGIAEELIILDPGMGGFLSRTPEPSWELLRQFERLTKLLRPFPILIGTSRKGFLGGPLAERDPLSQLTALHAVSKGATLVRTHNPKMMREYIATGKCLEILE